jgi:hypothetical protein
MSIMNLEITLQSVEAIDVSRLNKEELEKHCIRLLCIINHLKKRK